MTYFKGGCGLVGGVVNNMLHWIPNLKCGRGLVGGVAERVLLDQLHSGAYPCVHPITLGAYTHPILHRGSRDPSVSHSPRHLRRERHWHLGVDHVLRLLQESSLPLMSGLGQSLHRTQLNDYNTG